MTTRTPPCFETARRHTKGIGSAGSDPEMETCLNYCLELNEKWRVIECVRLVSVINL